MSTYLSRLVSFLLSWFLFNNDNPKKYPVLKIRPEIWRPIIQLPKKFKSLDRELPIHLYWKVLGCLPPSLPSNASGFVSGCLEGSPILILHQAFWREPYLFTWADQLVLQFDIQLGLIIISMYWLDLAVWLIGWRYRLGKTTESCWYSIPLLE